MNDRERAFLIAGMHAQKRWGIDPDAVCIIKVQEHSVTVLVPVVSTNPLLPWTSDGIVFSQETIHLEKLVDKDGTITWIGYGPRSNTLAVRG